MSFNKDQQQADKKPNETPSVFKAHDFINKEFLNFGAEDMAYIKPITISGQKIYTVHAADGTPISITETRDAAEYIISDKDMDAVTIH